MFRAKLLGNKVDGQLAKNTQKIIVKTISSLNLKHQLQNIYIMGRIQSCSVFHIFTVAFHPIF